MIVIGTDTHEGTGPVRGQREIKADEPGHLAAVRWARDLDEGRVWAIEDCRAVSRRFEQALLAAGERVVRVAPRRMGASRRGEREPGKSDQIDALAIARAVVKDGAGRFPAAHLDEQAMEIRLLLDHRSDLVAERARTVNRPRWHLLQLAPELERSVKPGAFNKHACLTASTAGRASCPPTRGCASHANNSPGSESSTARQSTSRQSRTSSSEPPAHNRSPKLDAAR
jgi:hypothetical protein